MTQLDRSGPLRVQRQEAVLLNVRCKTNTFDIYSVHPYVRACTPILFSSSTGSWSARAQCQAIEKYWSLWHQISATLKSRGCSLVVGLGPPPVRDIMASRQWSVQDRGSLLPGQEEARQVQHPTLPQRAFLTLVQYQGHVGARSPSYPPSYSPLGAQPQLGQAGSHLERK